LYGIICSSEYIDDIRQAVQGSSIWFEESGEFSADTFLIHCQSAASANVQTLIIDMNCVDDASVIRGVQQFRLKRDSRIVIIAPGRVPGDSTITALIGLQVLDIVAPIADEDSEEDERLSIAPLLKSQLASKPSYGNVVRWDVKTDEAAKLKELESLKKNFSKEKDKGKEKVPRGLGPDQSLLDHIHSLDIEPPPPRVKEKVVYKDRIIGTMIIAVGGADRRTGSTLTALKLAGMLANEGFKTACIERNDPDFSPATFHLYADSESKYMNNGFSFNGVDLFLEQGNERWLDEAYSNYEYIVLDMGQLLNHNRSSIYFHEFLRSNLHIVTTCTMDWDFDRFTQLIAYFQKEGVMKKINVLVNLSDDRRYEEFQSTFSKQEIDYFQMAFFRSSFSLDPNEIDDRTSSTYQKMLDSILSSKKKKSRWKFW
jgi:hypothetical protein